MDEETLLKLWGAIIPILTFIAGRWWYVVDSKRKADTKIFKKLEDALPHNIFRYFINDTWNMQCTSGYLNQYLDNYLRLIEDPINNFHNKKLIQAREKFDKSLKELFFFVTANFGCPDHLEQRDIMNLQSVTSHESERYERVFAEVNRLNNLVQSSYNNYIQMAKRKLLL